MHEFKIEAEGASCSIHEVTDSNCTHLSVPVAKADLVAGLVAILTDGEAREHFVDTVMITKNQTSVSVHAGGGSFLIPLTQIFPIVLGA